MSIYSKIIASGSYLPDKKVTNQDLETIVDTSDEWIRTRTGITKRYIASDQQNTSDLAYEAAKKAIEQANIAPNDIGLIIVATTTPDLTFPATAALVQAKLNVTQAIAFDVQAVCSGFVYAMTIADSMIKTGIVNYALIIGAETMSRILNWQDRSTCVLFGDGAGAFILAKSDKPGIIASKLSCDGSQAKILYTSGGVSSTKDAGTITMHGPEVFKHAVTKMADSVMQALKIAHLTIDDIDYLIPHQANIRIIEAVGKKLAIENDKVIVSVHEHANTSAASIPLAFDYAMLNNLIKAPAKIAICSFGAGISWGSIVLEL